MMRPRGFSLVELVVVMVLIAALATLGLAAIGSGLPGQQLRGAARELAAELRFTRAQAIATGREQVFSLDVGEKRWRGAGDRSGELPAAIALEVTGAREELASPQVVAIRFFPEGAATGGRIVLRNGDAAWRVDVAWLTGEVRLRRGEGAP
ncbi:MAG TPA: GspH/FimT family protein [Arenimonas sp.]|uniref:type II secretion system protein XpsH n=1 Tax=Arenimonas sp. TaxID=1872635 RepID=UPI002D7F2F48|nr:GspH/FimT family protein [Arenimonas sp.]HEU0151907.1 GspH/FimT family protein [Arenimonas sp.]